MTKKIIILGTGGNCIDILDTINTINVKQQNSEFQCIGFLDDDEKKWGNEHHDLKILGALSTAGKYHDCHFINGIGSEHNYYEKREILSKTGIPADKFVSIIHPSASVSEMSTIGYGVVIFQNVTITSNVKIGNQVIVLPNSVISHDNIIGDYTSIAGGVCLSGNVKVGNSCYLGTNSAIKNNLTIGDYSLVGMGSVVLNDVEEKSVVVGNPARFLRKVSV